MSAPSRPEHPLLDLQDQMLTGRLTQLLDEVGEEIERARATLGDDPPDAVFDAVTDPARGVAAGSYAALRARVDAGATRWSDVWIRPGDYDGGRELVQAVCAVLVADASASPVAPLPADPPGAPGAPRAPGAP